MRETIDRLRQEPPEHRILLAAIISIGVMVVLFVGWLFLFAHDLGDGQLEYQRPAQNREDSGTIGISSSSTMPTSSAPAAGLNGF